MSSFCRQVPEEHFKVASGEAALFELRMRLVAGKIPTAADLPIDTKLCKVRDIILEHYKSSLSDENVSHLKKACTIRNKLLHCEFSTTRHHLNELTLKTRNGRVTKLDIVNLKPSDISTRISEVVAGNDVGQEQVRATKTKSLKDIYGWLLECQGAQEFEEATKVFQYAAAILNTLSEK